MIQYEDKKVSEIKKLDDAIEEFESNPLAETLFIGEEQNLKEIKEKLSQKMRCPVCGGSGFEPDLSSCTNCKMEGEL